MTKAAVRGAFEETVNDYTSLIQWFVGRSLFDI